MIAVVYGPSGSGKTKRLLISYSKAAVHNITALVLKPYMPDVPLESQREVRSRDGVILKKDIYIYGIDKLPSPPSENKLHEFLLVENTHFMSKDEVKSIIDDYYGKYFSNIVFYGADKDINGDMFPSIEYLFSLYPKIVSFKEKLTTTCYFCGEKTADYTQRLINGVRAGLGPIILVEDGVDYVPACKEHFIPPREIQIKINDKILNNKEIRM